uniref:NADH-ubiquinone oxidoreductase chain 4L n=1 Tax=Microdiplogynium sp. XFX TaxID=2695875 RepID=A0A6B9WEL5_9ACAR|nr:NADH dehydrogenase subunit 4L [Microdiplogynium sp. XFX]
MLFVSLWLYVFGVMSLVSNRKHLLLLLLSLEMMMIGVLLISMYVFIGVYDLYSLVVFLSFVVCEASLGLSLVVIVVNYYGSDYVKGYDMMVC